MNTRRDYIHDTDRECYSVLRLRHLTPASRFWVEGFGSKRVLHFPIMHVCKVYMISVYDSPDGWGLGLYD